MALIGGNLGYNFLKKYAGQGQNDPLDGAVYAHKSKIDTLLGKQFLEEMKEKIVIDFGCGTGDDSIEMARRGASKVIGVDIQERFLTIGRKKAAQSKVSDKCRFVTAPGEKADVIVAIDSFEHFEDPAGILRNMSRMLNPGGFVIASFGPIWYHPYGGHLFSVFPWAHLIFTERSLIRWRSDFKNDGATRFNEVEGGLNQMTLKRFRKIVKESPFEFELLEPVPIRKLKWLANPLTKEFTTAIVRCKLCHKR